MCSVHASVLHERLGTVVHDGQAFHMHADYGLRRAPLSSRIPEFLSASDSSHVSWNLLTSQNPRQDQRWSFGIAPV